jgi:cytochrome P450
MPVHGAASLGGRLPLFSAMLRSIMRAGVIDSGTVELPPGPRLPGPIQTLWYTFGQPGFFARCRARFGSTWTARLPGFPPVVVTSDRDAIKRLFTGDPLRHRHGNDLLRRVLGDRSLLLLEPADHLARRRLELPPFHGEAVRAYGARIRELAEGEVESWREGEVVATHERARALTLEVILELVLGARDPALRSRLVENFDALDSPRNNLALFLPEVLTRRASWNSWAYAPLDRVHELLAEHVVRTRSDPALDERADVLSLWIRARNDQEGADRGRTSLTDADLRDELLTLVIAGHETTATAIGWACDLLAHNPAVAARLREDEDHEYLKATAKEVLRARTIAYASAARHPLEPFPIGDWVLGSDVMILVDAQGVHLNPDLYPQPETFRPERFLEHSPDKYAYIPFGGGAHRCLGASLAMLELELFIETLVDRVELAPDGAPARPVRRGVTLAPANGGRVRVSRVSAPTSRSRRAERVYDVPRHLSPMSRHITKWAVQESNLQPWA